MIVACIVLTLLIAALGVVLIAAECECEAEYDPLGGYISDPDTSREAS